VQIGWQEGVGQAGLAYFIISAIFTMSTHPRSAIQSYLVPTGQPFTLLCQSLARPRYFGRVDLHLHTTFSDGTYTPAEVVDLARRSGLSAIAITDHDTLRGILPAQQAAGLSLEVVSGVEITVEFHGRELHLLGYCFDPDNASLRAALDRLRTDRVGRFHEMVKRLDGLGVHIEEAEVARLGDATALGRRHLAELLVQANKVATVRDAFQRYLGDHGRATVPKTRLPVADAIALVRRASGVAAWAHPTYDCSRETLLELKRLGLGAIEAEYPAFRPGRIRALRRQAKELGLAVTGGSDCHGPGQLNRAVGASSITHEELQSLREMI
jgi:predicted metal-dependent phosphoesterase TrpH